MSGTGTGPALALEVKQEQLEAIGPACSTLQQMAEAIRQGRTMADTAARAVHVASGDEGVAVLDRIRRWLPVLLALSANSPSGREPTAATRATATKRGAGGRRRDLPNSSNPLREYRRHVDYPASPRHLSPE